METVENLGNGFDLPDALTPPCSVEECTEIIPLWSGDAELTQKSGKQKGNASVLIDTLPRPVVRFEFQVAAQSGPASGISLFRQLLDPNRFDAADLACGSPVGKLKVHPTNVSGETLGGVVVELTEKPTEIFGSAKFLVINGPSHRGSAIRRGRAAFAGRLESVTAGGPTVTVDGLSGAKQSARSVFAFTHIAEIRFESPQPIDRFEDVGNHLFRALSLMRGSWVGLVGPWLYIDGTLHTFSPSVTKAERNRSCQNWFPDAVLGVFEELFACLQTGYLDKARGEALQTGLHWLIESQQCAGGIEGSLVLEQAALESLAWFEIVKERKLCSPSGFEPLPASDKIRWLTSLYSIPTAIPPHCTEVVSYAKAYPPLNDLPDVLVDVRNALVHGSPKKVKRLFERPRGDDERTELWHLITGLLEQAVLAIAGYRGKILRRDIDAVWTTSAIKQVPWATATQPP